MNDESLSAILSQLCTGDTAAAEQTFRAYEPLLRNVVRRQLNPRLRSKFDSQDVVQSVWTDLLQGFREGGWSFNNTAQLRAFLVRAVHHRFIDRVRHHRIALKREEVGGPLALATAADTGGPRPSQVAQAEDTWQRLLAHCPTAHRPLLELKRQGLAVPEIAARTGLHQDSIRRILRELASKMALQP